MSGISDFVGGDLVFLAARATHRHNRELEVPKDFLLA